MRLEEFFCIIIVVSSKSLMNEFKILNLARKALRGCFGCGLLLLLILSGCSMYQNLTGYFNTYYNAKKIFSDAEDDINQKRFADRDTNYFVSYAPYAKTVNDKLDKVIEKCSKLLESYSQSSWVDDAVMMIGKSYVYKGESESALRKFQEMLDNFPSSDQRYDAKLWYAKADYFDHKDNDALKKIDELVPEAKSGGKDNIVLEAMMLQGQIFVDRIEYLQAAESFQHAADVPGDGEARAIAQFLSGQNYERTGDFSKASIAYNKVQDFKPSVDLDFRARLRYGVMLARSNQQSKALEVFSSLKDDQIKPENIALIQLETANTYNAMDDTVKAFGLYTLIDTTYRKTDASAKGNYQRGLTFEKKYLDFAQAKVYYDRARDEFFASEITPLAQKKSSVFAKYFGYYDTLRNYDSLLNVLLHPDTTHPSTDSTALGADTTAERPSAQGLVSEKYQQHDTSILPPRQLPGKDSLRNGVLPPAVRNNDFDRGEKALSNEARRNHRDESEDIDDEDTVSYRPVRPGKDADLRTAAIDSSKRKTRKIQRPPPPVVVVLTPDLLRSKIAQIQFELAGLLLLQFELPDSALTWYNQILHDPLDSSFLPRTLYAIAEIYRSRNDSNEVHALYDRILTEYGNSDYAHEVRKSLGMKVEETKSDQAESKYQEASELLQSGNPKNAINIFSAIAKKYPSSPFASKAVYTEGWIYENVLFNNDSATSCYRRLLTDYPNSVYASAVKPKIAVRDNPESLRQYVKTNEIQLINKEPSAQELNKEAARRNHEEGDEIQKGKGRNRDENDDEPDPDDDDSDNPDPDNN